MPYPSGKSVARSQFSSNLYGTVDIKLPDSKLCFGAGLSFANTQQLVRQDGVELKSPPEFQTRLDPLLVFQTTGGRVFWSAAWTPWRNAGRLDFGIIFGR